MNKHYISKESIRRVARTHFATVLAQTIQNEYDIDVEEATGMAASVLARLEANDVRFEYLEDVEWWFDDRGLCVNAVAGRGVTLPVQLPGTGEEGSYDE